VHQFDYFLLPVCLVGAGNTEHRHQLQGKTKQIFYGRDAQGAQHQTLLFTQNVSHMLILELAILS